MGADAVSETSRLSTMVDADDYQSIRESEQPLTINGQCSSSVLSKKASAIRRRHGYSSESLAVGATPHVKDVVVTRPTARDQAKRLVDTPFKIM